MKHKLGNGTIIKIEVATLNGLYESESKLITIDKRLRGREALETLLHELLHAELPKLTEDQVMRTARSQATAVWSVLRKITKGYSHELARRKSKSNPENARVDATVNGPEVPTDNH